MNRKLLIAIGIVGLVALGAAATDANAVCDGKGFQTAFGASNTYLTFPPDADMTVGGPNLKGRFWQTGNRANGNEGTLCPEITYMLDMGGGNLAIFGNMGGDVLGTGPCVNAGCPVGSMTILVQTKSTDGTKSYFAMGQISEDAAGFDFGRLPGGNWIVAEAPRAKVTTSGRTGTNVNLNVHFDAPSVFVHSEVAPTNILTGYQVFRVNSNTDPGRAPAAWGAPIQTVAAGSTGADIPLVIDCSAVATDVFIGTRAVFDNAQFSSDDISGATRVECDPTLADPRFKNIDKRKGKGPLAPKQ